MLLPLLFPATPNANTSQYMDNGAALLGHAPAAPDRAPSLVISRGVTSHVLRLVSRVTQGGQQLHVTATAAGDTTGIVISGLR